MTVEERAIEQAAKDEYEDFLLTAREQSLGKSAFIIGAKSPEAKAFHTKGMYSEEEVREIIDQIDDLYRPYHRNNILGWEYFEQNKKKS